MNTNQSTRGNINISEILLSGSEFLHPKENYNIIVVSSNNSIHTSLFETLKHFSLNGKGINLFSAKTLIEAKKIAEENRELILVIIDENITMNGSYAVFVDFVRNELKNQHCCITFKENLLKTNGFSPLQDISVNDDQPSEFFYARDRLIDITKMILLTHEMEHKIDLNGAEEGSDAETEQRDEDIAESPQKITSDKIYGAIAHDLKEPVANIKVILDFLTNEPDLLDQETSKDLLFRMRESANNVHEMLEDFLFWTRLFKQDIYFNPTRVDLAHTIRGNALLLKSTAGSKGISLVSELSDQLFAYADEYMISTVFRNLIYNSIKFSGENTEIIIDATRKSDMINISIKNFGMNLSGELLQKMINEMDLQSVKGMIKKAGTSLGLILCRDFIEKNGGTLEIVNKNDQNLEIIISLPAWK